MITTQEYIDIMEAYGSLLAAFNYFTEEEPDHEIINRLNIELRRIIIDKLIIEYQQVK